MGKKTKIDWCDSSWNPVTGCEHGCPYCYARGIAERFGTNWLPDENPGTYKCVLDGMETHAIIELDGMQARMREDGKIAPAPYPLGFAPTLHRYRLDEPRRWTKSRNIFVCSMADLFGAWVPDEWIEAVINACLAAPQHRYLFLTKNPARYMHLIANGIIPENQPNFWFGSTSTIPEMEFFWCDEVNTFVSIEPILAPFEDLTDEGVDPASKTNWIIVGAETGNRKNKVVPQKSWIDEIVSAAKKAGTPVFMKESLREIMGDDFKQEFPWEV
jgi:protein gp37